MTRKSCHLEENQERELSRLPNLPGPYSVKQGKRVIQLFDWYANLRGRKNGGWDRACPPPQRICAAE